MTKRPYYHEDGSILLPPILLLLLHYSASQYDCHILSYVLEIVLDVLLCETGLRLQVNGLQGKRSHK